MALPRSREMNKYKSLNHINKLWRITSVIGFLRSHGAPWASCQFFSQPHRGWPRIRSALDRKFGRLLPAGSARGSRGMACSKARHSCEKEWQKCAIIASAMMSYMARHYADAAEYPILSYICSALSCIIVSTADCYREFSHLRLIQTSLRNSIAQDSLNHAMQVSINTDRSVFNYSAATKHFPAENTKRRGIWNISYMSSYRYWLL